MNYKVTEFMRDSKDNGRSSLRLFVVLIIVILCVVAVSVAITVHVQSESNINAVNDVDNVDDVEIKNIMEQVAVNDYAVRAKIASEMKVEVDAVDAMTVEEDEDSSLVEDTVDKVDAAVVDDIEEVTESTKENSYYMNVEDINSHSGLNASEIGELLYNYENLRGLETTIYEIDKEKGINAFFIIAVLRLESGNGEYTSGKNNYFNTKTMSGEWVDYENKYESVEAFGDLISKQYFSEDGLWYREGMRDGVSLKELEYHYCPFEELDPAYNTVEWIEYNEQFRWSYRVREIMQELLYTVNNTI